MTFMQNFYKRAKISSLIKFLIILKLILKVKVKLKE
jgi:hypothetical protein